MISQQILEPATLRSRILKGTPAASDTESERETGEGVTKKMPDPRRGAGADPFRSRVGLGKINYSMEQL